MIVKSCQVLKMCKGLWKLLECLPHAKGSWIRTLAQESWALEPCPGSSLLHQGSGIKDPGCRILHPGFTIQDTAFSISILDLRSRIPIKIGDQRFRQGIQDPIPNIDKLWWKRLAYTTKDVSIIRHVDHGTLHDSILTLRVIVTNEGSQCPHCHHNKTH